MHCKDMLGVLSDYIDGELETQLCAEIERHAATCGNCRIVIDTLQRTILLYRQEGETPVPPDVKQRLYAVLQLPLPEGGSLPGATREPLP